MVRIEGQPSRQLLRYKIKLKRTGIPSLYSASKPEAIRDSGGVRTVDEILGILTI